MKIPMISHKAVGSSNKHPRIAMKKKTMKTHEIPDVYQQFDTAKDFKTPHENSTDQQSIVQIRGYQVSLIKSCHVC